MARDIMGCCDVRATNYDYQATSCCADCCRFVSPAPNGKDVPTHPTALYPQVGKPSTPYPWKQYTTTTHIRGGCTNNGILYKMEIPANRRVWARVGASQSTRLVAMPICPPMGVPLSTLIPVVIPQTNGGNGGGNGTGNGLNGANGTYLRTAGFDFGKYKYYIIGAIVIIGYLWYTGKLKKLIP